MTDNRTGTETCRVVHVHVHVSRPLHMHMYVHAVQRMLCNACLLCWPAHLAPGYERKIARRTLSVGCWAMLPCGVKDSGRPWKWPHTACQACHRASASSS